MRMIGAEGGNAAPSGKAVIQMTEPTHLHIGLLGFGAMGRTHLWAVRNIPFFYGDLPFCATVDGICTTTIEKSSRVAREFAIPIATANEDDLIENPDLDVIDICTPNNCHYQTVKKALAAGKHVLCEKPLCLTAAEAAELADLERASGKTCGMVFNNRWLAPVMRAKQLIDDGRLGDLVSYHAVYRHNSCLDPTRRKGWKQDRTICGGGTLYDLGSHVIDLMSWLCGPVARASGRAQIVCPTHTDAQGNPWQTNADEAFYMIAETTGGAVGTMEFSKVAIGSNDDLAFEIYGKCGSLRFSLMEPNWLYFYDATARGGVLGGEQGYTRIECVGRYPGMVFPSPKAPAGWLYGHLGSMHAFLSAVAVNAPFSPSLADGAAVQSVIETVAAGDMDLRAVKSC